MTGKFITFEGPEGSGKTSVIEAVERYLTHNGYNVVLTREPGGKGSDIAESIRGILLDTKNKKMVKETEALLFAASRAQHYAEVIKPNIEKGAIILCDRFLDSSLAYQGFARDLGVDKVLKMNQFGIGDFMPDMTIFIDVPPKIGLNRVFGNKGRKVDRLDLEKISFHEKVYQGYMQLTKIFKDRFIVIDGTNDVETVIEDTLQVLMLYLKSE